MKCSEVKDKILAVIEEKQLRPGMKIPPFRTLAAELKSCVPTIQRAIAQLVSEGILTSRVGSGTYVATLAGKNDKMIGILIPHSTGLSPDFITENLEVIRHTLMANGYIPITVSPPSSSTGKERSKAERNLIMQLIEHQVSGIIIDSLAPGDDDFWGDLEKLSVPVVLFNNCGFAPTRFDCVLSDNYRGGYLAGLRLIEANRHNCCFYSTDDGSVVEQERFRGFCVAFGDAGLTQPIVINHNKENFDRACQCDGIFCLNDNIAYEVIKGLKTAGIAVPEKISVMGFDNSLLCTSTEPNMDSIEQQFRVMGQRTAELMMRRIENPNLREQVTVRLDVTLIRRHSVGD
ncbi:MAG: substrate-binding domain-containing protein [Victivallales bacterium]|jgi:GntR family transcriptional regulator of arabinose operon|nr:substrate-binding domain-containing protein [Victivallales bacterium]